MEKPEWFHWKVCRISKKEHVVDEGKNLMEMENNVKVYINLLNVISLITVILFLNTFLCELVILATLFI